MNELDASSLLAIVSHLKKPSDLLHVAQASTALASVCRAQSLWQQLLQDKFDLVVSAQPGDAAPAPQAPETDAAHSAAAAAAAAGGPTTGGPNTADNGNPHQQQPQQQQRQRQQQQQLDLQETFKALATRPPPRALRFAAVFTDGGCDGMKEDDLTYWADHAFQPNHWNPYCSDGKSNINIVGLLHPLGVAGDEQLSRHRVYLVERCATAAAVLFSPPGQDPPQSRSQAAASLKTWSTTGLERLFMDLYQDLWLNQQESTWGRLLLSGIPQPSWPAELERLGNTAEAIQSNTRQELYADVDSVPPDELTAAAAAAAGGSGAWQQLLRQQREGGVAGGEAPGQTPAAAGGGGVAGCSSSSGGGGGRQQGQLPLQQQKQQLLEQQQQEQQQQQWHMVDRRLLPWLSTPALAQSTALVEEVVVSRVGHFTCPVAAGAVLLGQQPLLNTTSSSSSGGCGGSNGSSGGSNAESAQVQAVLRLKHDPLVAALDGMTSYGQVVQAVSAGLLPPILQHQQRPGVEWCEFTPLDRQQRVQRQQQGLYMRPIVWFRFSTPEPPAGAQAAAPAALGQAAPAAPAGPPPIAVVDAFEAEVADAVAAALAGQDLAAQPPAAAAAAAAAGGGGGGGDGIGGHNGAAAAPAAAAAVDLEGPATPTGQQEQQVWEVTGDDEMSADDDSTNGMQTEWEWGGPAAVQAAALAGATAAAAPPAGATAAAAAPAAGGTPVSPSAAAAAADVDEGYADVSMSDACSAPGLDSDSMSSEVESDGMADAAGEAADAGFVTGPFWAEAYGEWQPAAAVQQAAQALQPQQQQQLQQQQQEVGVGLAPGGSASASVPPSTADGSSRGQLNPGAAGQAGSSSGGAGRGSGGLQQRAPWQQRGAAGVSVLPAPASVSEVEHSGAEGHMLARMQLSSAPRSGNVVCVKLISCEDRMAEFEDPSEQPNIDVQYVALRGVAVTLDAAAGLQLL